MLLRRQTKLILGLLLAVTAEALSPVWNGAEESNDGWLSLDWFGRFQEMTTGWIYHQEHGFQYVVGTEQTDLKLFDVGLNSWIQVSSETYPFLYKFGDSEGWFWYYAGGEPGSRQFRDVSTGNDVYEPVLSSYTEPVYSLIPAGSFDMGDTLDATYNNGLDRVPVHTVYISEFTIQQTHVTNGQFAKVMNWAMQQGLLEMRDVPYPGRVFTLEGDPQEIFYVGSAVSNDISWDGSQFVIAEGKGVYPCFEVTWYGAMAYCNLLTRMEGGLDQAIDLSDWSMDITVNGYRLPTEAEWEKAARGGRAGTRFYWENLWITHEDANYYAIPAGGYVWDKSATSNYHPDWIDEFIPYTNIGGAFPANGYGLYDMAGNLNDWCWDWYWDSYYWTSPASDPMGPETGTQKIRRGGSWDLGAEYARVAFRYFDYPQYSNERTGFRVVQSVIGN